MQRCDNHPIVVEREEVRGRPHWPAWTEAAQPGAPSTRSVARKADNPCTWTVRMSTPASQVSGSMLPEQEIISRHFDFCSLFSVMQQWKVLLA
jgi:hypothetical protein